RVLNQHQSVRRLAREQGVGVTDLGLDSLQRGGLFAGVPTPIAWVRKQFFGRNASEFTNPIPNCCCSFWFFSPHPAHPPVFVNFATTRAWLAARSRAGPV